MTKLSKLSFLLLLLSFTLIGCNNENLMENKINDEVLESKEFKALNDAFSSLEEMDDLIFKKKELNLKNGNISKSRLNKYSSLHIVNDSHKKDIIAFYNEIGIKNAKQFYLKRKQILTIDLPSLGNKLGEKFPELKELSDDDLNELFFNYKKNKYEK